MVGDGPELGLGLAGLNADRSPFIVLQDSSLQKKAGRQPDYQRDQKYSCPDTAQEFEAAPLISTIIFHFV